jgi:hypothetical protein
MMPIQISRRLREWRQDQELQNYRAGLIAHCVLAAAPRKKGSKIPNWREFFGGKQRPKAITDPKAGRKAMMQWAKEVNQAF